MLDIHLDNCGGKQVAWNAAASPRFNYRSRVLLHCQECVWRLKAYRTSFMIGRLCLMVFSCASVASILGVANMLNWHKTPGGCLAPG